MNAIIREILVGPIAPFGLKGEPSAYQKNSVSGLVKIDLSGFAGDEHADPQNHGGSEKAILHYGFEHYQ